MRAKPQRETSRRALTAPLPPARQRPRLLFLAYFFPPVRVMACVRTYNMAKWLARSGWEVTVVTPRASVWRRVEAATEIERALAREGIRCLRTRHPWTFLAPRHTISPYEKRGWLASRIAGRLAMWARRTARRLNIAPEVGWVREAEKACAQLPPDQVDLILATGSPFATFGLARKLSCHLQRPYVLDYRDLWSEYPHAERRQSREPTLEEEGGPLAECAAAIGVSAGMVRVLQRRFGLGSKIHLVTNGYDAETLSSVAPHNFGHFAIVYAGHFHPPKSVITPLMAALARLKKIGSASPVWAFHYYGRHPDHVREEAQRFGLEDRVVLHGEVLWRAALSAVRGAGMAVVISSVKTDASLGEKGMLTGKIFEAIGLRRPLLVIAPPGSDLESVLDVAGLGRRFSGDEVEAMASYLVDAMEGRIPAPACPEAFDWARIGADLDRLLRAILREVSVAAG